MDYQIIIRVLLVLLVAIGGSLITSSSINSWYFTNMVIRPPQAPASIWFGIVWTTLYILYALVWRKVYQRTGTKYDWTFVLSLFLNIMWVYVFFGRKNIGAGKFIIVALLLLTLYQAYLMWDIGSGLMTLVMLIYASWLTVASGLNFNTTLANVVNCA